MVNECALQDDVSVKLIDRDLFGSGFEAGRQVSNNWGYCLSCCYCNYVSDINNLPHDTIDSLCCSCTSGNMKHLFVTCSSYINMLNVFTAM